jgi:hypothetical protein
MVTSAENALGRVVRRYEADDSRRGWTALVALIIGLGATAIGIPVTIATFEQGSDGAFAGLVLGIALVFTWAGISQGLRWTNRHGEVYTVREGGLTYHCTGESRAIPWDDIEKVADNGQNNAISRPLGWDVHCRITVKNGRRLLISGFTKDGAHLARTVELAVNQGVRPTPRQTGR